MSLHTSGECEQVKTNHSIRETGSSRHPSNQFPAVEQVSVLIYQRFDKGEIEPGTKNAFNKDECKLQKERFKVAKVEAMPDGEKHESTEL